MRSIKYQSELNHIANRIELTYDNYCDLLLSATTNYDSRQKSISRRSSRTFYEHEVYEDVSKTNDDEQFSINLSFDDIQAYFDKLSTSMNPIPK